MSGKKKVLLGICCAGVMYNNENELIPTPLVKSLDLCFMLDTIGSDIELECKLITHIPYNKRGILEEWLDDHFLLNHFHSDIIFLPKETDILEYFKFHYSDYELLLATTNSGDRSECIRYNPDYYKTVYDQPMHFNDFGTGAKLHRIIKDLYQKGQTEKFNFKR